MNKKRSFSLGIIALLCMASTSWGWVRGRFRGPRVGVAIGVNPWWSDPYWEGGYYPYDYDYGPYYYPQPYAAYPPYMMVPVQPSQQQQNPPAPDTSHHDLRNLNAEVARTRERIQFERDDGDISDTDSDVKMQKIAEIEKQAHEQAKSNGGWITGDQQRDFVRELRNL